MANEPSQYPTPVFPGGLREGMGTELRPLRNYLGSVRQPDLGQPPQVASITGFGSGSGANITHNGAEADKSQGRVRIFTGPNPGTSGTVVLDFSPNTPGGGQYVFFADWATSLTPAIVGNRITVTWAASGLPANARLIMSYQWAVST